MFCRNCGYEVNNNAHICTKCGFRPLKSDLYCPECGVETKNNQEVCVGCGIGLNIKKNKLWLGFVTGTGYVFILYFILIFTVSLFSDSNSGDSYALLFVISVITTVICVHLNKIPWGID
jgi:hypothetical protein